jgi:hypothetical protein
VWPRQYGRRETGLDAVKRQGPNEIRCCHRAYVLCLIADITFSSDVTLEKLLGFTGSIGLGGGSGWSSVLAVRTGRLRRSLAVHSRPIDLVVFQEPSHESCWKPRLGGGFALRCLQRLSGPDLATRRCP